MRILLLAPHPFFQHRGTPLAERAVLEFLAHEGHQVDVLTYHEGEDVTLAGCRIHRIPKVPGVHGIRPGFSLQKLLCDLLLFGTATRLLYRQRYDLIHAVEESVFVAALLGGVARIPYIYDMDSSLVEQVMDRYPLARVVAPAFRLAERHAVRRSLGVLAVCRAVEDTARRHAPTQLIARVEDTTLLTEDDQALPPILPPGGPIVMYVGNLERYQGIDLLLEGFAHAAGRVPTARLFIVGGHQAGIETYRARGAALGIGERLHFAGQQSVHLLGAYLRQADVLVSPRLTGHNTPMKVYSYLDSGRAVIATRIPTHTQFLDDEIACLVEPTPGALGDGLVELLADPARRERLAARARERVQALYTPAVARRKLSAFYAAVEAGLRQAAAE